MGIYFNMFFPLMKHGIISNIKSRLTSQNIFIPCICSTPKSLTNCFSHFNSHVKVAIDLYSTSTEQRETVCCFLNFARHKRQPKQHKPACQRATGQRTTWPIGMTPLFQLQCTTNHNSQSASQCSLGASIYSDKMCTE